MLTMYIVSTRAPRPQDHGEQPRNAMDRQRRPDAPATRSESTQHCHSTNKRRNFQYSTQYAVRSTQYIPRTTATAGAVRLDATPTTERRPDQAPGPPSQPDTTRPSSGCRLQDPSPDFTRTARTYRRSPAPTHPTAQLPPKPRHNTPPPRP